MPNFEKHITKAIQALEDMGFRVNNVNSAYRPNAMIADVRFDTVITMHDFCRNQYPGVRHEEKEQFFFDEF